MTPHPARSRTTAVAGCLILVLLSSSCDDRVDANVEKDGFIFPTQADRPETVMQELVEGRLTLEGDCLRVVPKVGSSELIIWPQGFTHEKSGDVVEVFDRSGALLATTGNVISLGGGEAGDVDAIRKEISDACSGPYWITGEIPD